MSTTFLFLDQQLGNDHQVVGQHGSANQQLEPLVPLRQATFHATTTEENRYVTFATRRRPAPERWPFLSYRDVLVRSPAPEFFLPPHCGTHTIFTPALAKLNILFLKKPRSKLHSSGERRNVFWWRSSAASTWSWSEGFPSNTRDGRSDRKHFQPKRLCARIQCP